MSTDDSNIEIETVNRNIQLKALFKSLRVVLVKTNKDYEAHGLDIHYFASGSSVERAIDAFINSLEYDIKRHMTSFNTCVSLLKPPDLSQAVWKYYYNLDIAGVCGYIKHIALPNEGIDFPFSTILFLESIEGFQNETNHRRKFFSRDLKRL